MRRAFLLGGVALLASACTSTPVPRHFEASGQLLAASAAHWRLIARDAVARVRPGVQGDEVGVRHDGVATPFSRAFTGFAETALIESGLRLAPRTYHHVAAVPHGRRSAAHPVLVHDVLRFEVQVVDHDRDDRPHPVAGTAIGTIAGAAVWLVAAPPVSLASAAALPIGAGAGILHDALPQLLPRVPGTEIIVTVSLSRLGRDVHRWQGIYYIESRSAALYDGDRLVRPETHLPGGVTFVGRMPPR